MKYLFVK